MRAGVLNTRAALQARVASDDGAGGELVAYTTVASLWLGIAAQSGRELTAAKQQNAQLTHLVTARYRPDAATLARMRLVVGTPSGARVLEIHAAYDPDGRREQLHLLCEERPDA
jgi:SPP1 family predicted phage head-tail adaptor